MNVYDRVYVCIFKNVYEKSEKLFLLHVCYFTTAAFFSQQFRVPECPEYAKAKIKELLPHGLHEPISKVRYVVLSMSMIAKQVILKIFYSY